MRKAPTAPHAKRWCLIWMEHWRISMPIPWGIWFMAWKNTGMRSLTRWIWPSRLKTSNGYCASCMPPATPSSSAPAAPPVGNIAPKHGCAPITFHLMACICAPLMPITAVMKRSKKTFWPKSVPTALIRGWSSMTAAGWSINGARWV